MQTFIAPPTECGVGMPATTLAIPGGIPMKSQEMDDVLEILIRSGGESHVLRSTSNFSLICMT